jgi:hypothetical protein
VLLAALFLLAFLVGFFVGAIALAVLAANTRSEAEGLDR